MDPFETARQLVKEKQDQERKTRETLSIILDDMLKNNDFIPVTKVKEKDNFNFVGSLTYDYVDKRVQLAIEMPLLKHKVDKKTGELFLDEETFRDVDQRQPKFERAFDIGYYLARDPNATLTPLVCLVSENWINEPNGKNRSGKNAWDSDGRATLTSMQISDLDGSGRLNLLNLSNPYTTIHALDGQHRVLGIRLLMEASRTEVLCKRKGPVGSKTIKPFKIPDDIPGSDLKKTINAGINTIGCVFIPSVIKGETRDEARLRVKQTFIAINQTARPLTINELKSQNAGDAISVMARDIAFSHELFVDVVDLKNKQIDPKSQKFIPLNGLYNSIMAYLENKSPFSQWDAFHMSKGQVFMLPPKEEIDEAMDLCRKVFDELKKLNSLAPLTRPKPKPLEWREFPKMSLDASNPRKGHLLYRHPAFTALLGAISYCHFSDDIKMSLDDIFTKLRKADAADKMSNMNKWESIFCNIFFKVESNSIKVGVSDQKLLKELFIYLLGGLSENEIPNLEEAYKKARTANQGEVLYNCDGTKLEEQDFNQFKLPEKW